MRVPVLRAAGFEAELAGDGLEGLEKVDALHPALVVPVLMMPTMACLATPFQTKTLVDVCRRVLAERLAGSRGA